MRFCIVTNGVYAVGQKDVLWEWWGGFASMGLSRVVVTNSIKLESVNGPLVTIVQGAQPDEDGEAEMRCVYLGTNAMVSGFTLTNGSAGGNGTGGDGGGVFSESGGTVTNCLLIGNGAAVSNPCSGKGVSGGKGGGAWNCTLYNCTLTGNSAQWGGGAATCNLFDCTVSDNSAVEVGWCLIGGFGGGGFDSVLYNCTLTGNSAMGQENGYGGGAYGGTLYGCTLSGNVATSDGMSPRTGLGGGAYGSTLNNCTLTGNSADGYGGAAGGWLYNCTVVGNSSGVGPYWDGGECNLYNSILYHNSGGNYDNYTTLNYCCTTPLPTNGVGNITGSPLFMDMAAGDFRLREDSPCIDAGTNLLGSPMMGYAADWNWVVVGHITDPTDILGNTRFIDGNGNGTVAWDIGAYEFNSFRPPRFAVQPQLAPDGWRLNISGAPNKWARLQRSSDLKNWEDVWSGFMGAEGAQQVNDSDTGQKAMFYRVVVP